MKHTKKEFKTVGVKGGKQYVEVKERVSYMAHDFEGEYSIDTVYEYFDSRKMWVVKATVTIKQGDSVSTYTGLAQEVESDNYKQVNFTSALENCETSAVGRALANAGVGIDQAIASADEVTKAINRSNQKQAEAPEVPVKAKPVTKKESIISSPEEIKAKANLLRLLNSHYVTPDEKERMTVAVGGMNEDRAVKAVKKLSASIEVRRNEARAQLLAWTIGDEPTAEERTREVERIASLTDQQLEQELVKNTP